ncbi:MAG: OmpA/MotB domain protein [uncultured Thiotrichaceae bacterium]|uniref:OmpA/MotB domain protein n=1 Tax=uncultured Thiotrichaceae bacterium TaxID=298394 RepID=A0A6S6T297_9GAMM|nr:MAG: OmpA/MotB domain protein [uncultured Thiotrichaceae bacterium]
MQRAWVIQFAGLAAILLLLAFALPRYAQMVPEKIADHVQHHLHEKGMTWAGVRPAPGHSRSVLLNGSAPDAEAQQAAVNDLRSLWYIQQVQDTTTPKIIEPYTLHIQWDGDKLALDGYVSSAEDKAEIAEQIRSEFGNNADLEKLQAGLGAPEYWETLIHTVLLKEIKPLPSASVRMVGHTINFAGKVATTQKAEALSKALRPIEEKDYHLAVNIIPLDIIEPYTLHIQWDGDKLALDGYVSNADTKAKLVEQIKSAFGDNAHLEKLQTGSGTPKHWETLISTVLLEAIKPLQSASVRMVDQTLSFAGKTDTTRQAKALEKALQPFAAKGYATSVNVIALDNAAVVCQREFNRLLTQETIVFSTGGAGIHQESNALLQELADAAIFCAGTTILISGHTDDVGNEEDNFKLSEQRAKAVKGWLFRQGGVPLERMKTSGKGASEPLADNDTEAGRAKNRRIEFVVEGI